MCLSEGFSLEQWNSIGLLTACVSRTKLVRRLGLSTAAPLVDGLPHLREEGR